MKLATVIGGQGFIGQALVSHLLASGWDCVVPQRHAHWPEMDKPLGHVFYCAGLTADYIRRPADTVEAHVCLLSKVLQSASFKSLVYLSSTRLYDGLSTDDAATEDAYFRVSSQEPRHLYDLSKLTGESICQALGQGRARVARLSCVYHDHTDEDGFLPMLMRKVAATPQGATLAVASSPWFARDYVGLSDVVSALVAIAENGCQPVYNVAGGENLRNDELARFIETDSGRRLLFESDQPAREPLTIDISRMREEFAWNPKNVFEQLGPWLRALP